MLVAVTLLSMLYAWWSIEGVGPLDQLPFSGGLAPVLWPVAVVALASALAVRTVSHAPGDAEQRLQTIRWFRRARRLSWVLWWLTTLVVGPWWIELAETRITWPVLRELVGWFPLWGSFLASSLILDAAGRRIGRLCRAEVPNVGMSAHVARPALTVLSASILPMMVVAITWRLLPAEGVRWLQGHPWVIWSGVVAGIVLLSPRWVRWALGVRPLEDGELRRRLHAMAAESGVVLDEILVWPTRYRVLNAAVLGLWPGRGTLLLSDRLVWRPAGDVLALAAHEIGHLRRCHSSLRLAAIALPILIALLWNAWFSTAVLWEVAVVAVVLAWLVVTLPLLARWTEYDADRWAAGLLAQVDGEADLSRALRRMARSEPALLRGDLLHPPLARRLAALRRSGPMATQHNC